MTVKEIKSILDANNIKYDSKAKKDDLLALIPTDSDSTADSTADSDSTADVKKYDKKYLLSINRIHKSLEVRCVNENDIVKGNRVTSDERLENLFSVTDNRYKDTKNSIIGKSKDIIDKTNDFSVFEMKISKGNLIVLTTDSVAQYFHDLVRNYAYHSNWNLKHELVFPVDKIDFVLNKLIAIHNYYSKLKKAQ